jgi:hypothetical protein
MITRESILLFTSYYFLMAIIAFNWLAKFRANKEDKLYVVHERIFLAAVWPVTAFIFICVISLTKEESNDN